jgi:putative toxin-antitoxin system antitoxin component (TIGR02293 family)
MSNSDLPVKTESVYTRMSRLLDLKIESEVDAVRVAKEGISSRSYQRVADKLRLAATSTTRRSLAKKGRLNWAESERILRLIRVYSEADQLFGDERATLEWLHAPADFLQNGSPVTPLRLAESDSGARLVETLIRRTAHGF